MQKATTVVLVLSGMPSSSMVFTASLQVGQVPIIMYLIVIGVPVVSVTFRGGGEAGLGSVNGSPSGLPVAGLIKSTASDILPNWCSILCCKLSLYDILPAFFT